jgi:hypothetical protein
VGSSPGTVRLSVWVSRRHHTGGGEAIERISVQAVQSGGQAVVEIELKDGIEEFWCQEDREVCRVPANRLLALEAAGACSGPKQVLQ